jgi:hypothetical protein
LDLGKKDNPKGEKEEDKQTKKQYCPFHKRETIHKPKDFFFLLLSAEAILAEACCFWS